MTTKITNTDRASILHDAWARARAAASAASEGVRLHIGAAMRAAWSDAKNVALAVEMDRVFANLARLDAERVALGYSAPAAWEDEPAVELYDDGRDGFVSASMVPQPAQQQQADASPVEPVAAPAAVEPELIEVEHGRAEFTRRGDLITFRGQVTGGGVAGPGHVSRYVSFGDRAPVRMHQDNRSGSQRSGTCLWRLEPDAIYWLSNVAMDSRRSDAFGLSTYDGGLRVLGIDACERERRRVWPLQAEEHDAAQVRRREEDARRIEVERAVAEERRVAREALAEMNAEEARRIKAEGQPRVADLPKLTGTAKQVAFALKIRDAVRARQPGLPELKAQRASKFWIENHRAALR